MRPFVVARASVAVAVVVAGAGCQLFGERPRCDPLGESTHHACAPSDFCAPDGFCRLKPPLDECEAVAADTTRAVHMSIAASGVAAMGNALAGVDAVVVADAHACNSANAGVSGQTVGAASNVTVCSSSQNGPGVQPLGSRALAGGDTLSTKLDVDPLRYAVAGLSYDEGVTIEALFKSLSQAPGSDVTIASMLTGTDGWRIEEQAGGALVLVAGAAQVQLAAPADATWHHVLCTIDVAALASGDIADDVICAVDGDVAGPAEPAADAGSIHAPHELVLGGTVSTPSPSDAEVAVVRLWNGADPFHEQKHTLDRVDALVDEERTRLMRYLGLFIDVPSGAPRFLDTNAGDDVRAQPIVNGAVNAFVLVPGGWPRLAHSAGSAATPGLLLEPQRENLLSDSVIECATPSLETAPSGRRDACAYATGQAIDVSEVQQRFDVDTQVPNFQPGTPFVFSAFLFADVTRESASIDVQVDGAGIEFPFTDGKCGITSDPVSGVHTTPGSDDDCELQRLDDGWVRIVDHFEAKLADIKVHLAVQGSLWSPQLEIGSEPTTPMDRVRERAADSVVMVAPGLANATSTALRATVVSDTVLAMAPLFVADDGDDGDHVASLTVGPGVSGTSEPRLVVIEKARQDVTDGTFTYAFGKKVRIGADLGNIIDACDRCKPRALNTSLPAAEQWEQVGLQGGAEPGLLVDADVVTSGTTPLPLALEMSAQPPLSGCLEGKRPDVALAACDQGACSEDSPATWRAKGAVHVEDGPSVDEQGVAGTWTADLKTDAKTTDELYLEVRFVPSGDTGDIVVLSDGIKDFLRVATDRGDAVVSDAASHEAVRIPGAWRAGEWTQLSCWLGLQSRCVLNAGEPIDAGGLSFSRKPLQKVTVGGAASLTAFARVWHVAAQRAKVDIDRLVGARVAASFGLKADPRRAGFELQETRTASASLARKGQTFTVGPHWPRVVDDGGGAVYVADPGEGLLLDTRDLSDAQNLTLQLAFTESPAGQLIELSNDEETITLTRADNQLQFQHGASEPVSLDGLDGNGVVFGVRQNLLTLERLEGPTLAQSPSALSKAPMKRASISNPSAPLRLRRLHIGTR